jgi:hypothetical protein
VFEKRAIMIFDMGHNVKMIKIRRMRKNKMKTQQS